MIVLAHHTTPLRLGTWAVYVFFILSGYWIARMWDEKYSRTRAPVITFLVSRWWRLAPVLFCCLAVVISASWALNWPLRPITLSWALRQVLVVGSTFGPRVVPPQWSIDVEMQFYLAAALLFPGLSVLCRPRGRGNAVILTVSLVAFVATLVHLTTGGSPDFPILWPAASFFLVGILIWKSNWDPPKQVAILTTSSFIAVAVLIVILPESRSALLISGRDPVVPHFAQWPVLLQAIGSLMMVPFICRNVRATSSPLDRLLGNWAYPLYLFHWLPREWYYRHVDWAKGSWYNVTLFAVNVIVALFGSLVILQLIDRPMDQIRSRWVRGRLLPGLPRKTIVPSRNEVADRNKDCGRAESAWTGL